METDKNKEKENMGEKIDNRSEECCFYVMDPCGEYYLSSGCCCVPVRYC